MFALRLTVCLLILIVFNGFESIKGVQQYHGFNDIKQRLNSDIKTEFLQRRKRQIRNYLPGQKQQVQGVEPSVHIYLENEKDLETLLTNSTLDDIIKTAERDFAQNTNPQYLGNTNGQILQYQQQQTPKPVTNYNAQRIYNNINPSAAVTAEAIWVPYDQLNSYLARGSTIISDKNQNDQIILVDENIKFPIEEIKLPVTNAPTVVSQNTAFQRVPNTEEVLNLNNNKQNSADSEKQAAIPKETPRSPSPEPGRPPTKKTQPNYDTKPPDNATENERGPDDYDRRPANYDRWPADYSRRPVDYDKEPPDYDRRPYDFNRRPDDFGHDRRPFDSDRRPYDRWHRGWGRRPPYGRGDSDYGWRPPSHGRGPPPHAREGAPPHHRGRGSSEKDKERPYVINLNFDSRANGTLRDANRTLTEGSKTQEQNSDVYETLKSIFNPNSREDYSDKKGVKLDAKTNDMSAVPGFFQVMPVTPAT